MCETVTLPVLRTVELTCVKPIVTVRVLQEAAWPQMAVILCDDGKIGMVDPQFLRSYEPNG